MILDVLVFAAHPDDAELSMGGTIAKLTSNGFKVGVIDLSQGEMGSRGTKETRKSEWEEAAKILNLTLRDNLKFPDGQIRPNPQFVLEVVKQIRRYKPVYIFAPHFHDRHPDHTGASQIVKEAFFLGGAYKYKSVLENKVQAAHRPKRLFYYMQTFEVTPSFVVDVSETYETRVKAIKAYGTQFHNPDNNSNDPETFISKPEFLEYLEARTKTYGFKIGKRYGEPFFCDQPIEFDLLNAIRKEKD